MTGASSDDARRSLEPTQEALEAEIGRLAELIGADPHDVVGFDPFVRNDFPWLEIRGDQVYWLIKEDGLVAEERTTTDLDELLFWCFESTTFTLALNGMFPLRPGADVVADLWARQLELLYRLNPRWARWWREERRLLQRQSADKLPPMPDDSG